MAGNVNNLMAILQRILSGLMPAPAHLNNAALQAAQIQYNAPNNTALQRYRIARQLAANQGYNVLAVGNQANLLQQRYDLIDQLMTPQERVAQFQYNAIPAMGGRLYRCYEYNGTANDFYDILTAFTNRYDTDRHLYPAYVSVSLIVNGNTISSTGTRRKDNINLRTLIRQFRTHEYYVQEGDVIEFCIVDRTHQGGGGKTGVCDVDVGVINSISDDYCGIVCMFIASKNDKTWYKQKPKKPDDNKKLEQKALKYCEKNDLPIKKYLRWDDFKNYTNRPIYIIDNIPNVIYTANLDYECKPQFGPIYIFYYKEHYQLINSLRVFFTNFNGPQLKLCKFCFTIHEQKYKGCTGAKIPQCIHCDRKYTSVVRLKTHQESYKEIKCQMCEVSYTDCRWTLPHKCIKKLSVYCTICETRISLKKDNNRWIDHCNNGHKEEERCKSCFKYYNQCDNHTCEFSPLEFKNTNPALYAYDIECFAGPDGEQEFAMAYVVPTNDNYDNYKYCGSFKVFIEYVKSFNKPTYFIAHNGKGYDAPVIAKEFLEHGVKLKNIVLVGKKYFQFQVGQVKFWDSLNHLQMSLTQLPKAFGFADELGKGIFPYDFFTRGRNKFKGVVPVEYFNPEDREAAKELGEIKLWDYCKKYCLNDTQILAKAINKYKNNNKGSPTYLNPFGKMTKAGDALNTFRMLYLKPDKFYRVNPYVSSYYIEDGFHGGRCECFRQYYKVKDNEQIVCDDIKSEYPAVQTFDDLPGNIVQRIGFNEKQRNIKIRINGMVVDTPVGPLVNQVLPSGAVINTCDKFVNELLDDDLVVFFGIYDITPPPDLYIPVLGVLADGKYKFTNKKIIQGHYYSAELRIAMAKGYKITAVYGVVIFDKAVGVFKEYMEHFYSIKSSFEKGTPEYEASKIKLNSLWGKLAQSTEYYTTEFLTGEDQTQYYELIRRERDNEIDIAVEKHFTLKDEETCSVFKYTSGTSAPLGTKHIAAAITSCARIRLYKAMEQLGDKLLYCDTDSVYYITDKNNNAPIKTDSLYSRRYGFGLWDREFSGGNEFVCVRPKSYGLVSATETKIKAGGYLSCKITIDNYKDLVFEKEQTVVVDDGIKFNRGYIGVSVVKGTTKELRLIQDKRNFFKDGNGEFKSVALTE